MRCDNAGEKKSFEELSKKEGLGIKFEYTSPGSPQQNGKCERKFATLYGKVRSMLNGARLTPNLRHGLWTECAACETMEENIYRVTRALCHHTSHFWCGCTTLEEFTYVCQDQNHRKFIEENQG